MHNTNGVRQDCRDFLEISQQRCISETERFCPINALDVWKTYVCKSAVSKMNQVKSKDRNRMAVETLDDSRRLANTEDDSIREASTGVARIQPASLGRTISEIFGSQLS